MHTKKIVAIVTGAAMFLIAGVAFADTATVDFENPPYLLGSVSGQDGWSNAVNPAYDQAVVANTYGYSGFGSQSFRVSDAVTSGSFGDWIFTKSLANEAGETAAQNGGYSGGTRQTHFEAQFDIASTQATQQPGLHLSVSPDRGDGARMSYLRFVDQADGVHVFFDDYQDNAPFGASVGDAAGCGNEDTFTDNDIATLTRTPHTIKFVMDFVDGQKNDVVKIYIDGVLKATGTSWEGYFNYCEGNPTRTVDSLIIQSRTGSGPLTNPADTGKGFLIDNLSLLSGAVVDGQVCSDITLQSSTNTQFKGLTTTDPLGSSLAALFTLGTSGAAVNNGPDGFPGAWDGPLADPNLSGSVWVSNMVTAPSNPAGVGAGQDGNQNVWRLYTQGFTLPAGAVVAPSTLYFSADNSVSAYLDNVLLGSNPGFASTVGSPYVPTVGAHEFEFVVKNDAYDGPTNPTGVIYKTKINYCVPLPPPPPTAEIHGSKFYDVNANGTKDPGEPTLSGWVINLAGNGSQTTDGSGTYAFTALAAGSYTPTETLKPGWTQTRNPGTITLTNGQVVNNADFGNSCFVGTGGKGLGFWTNKNGQAMEVANDFVVLTSLNLRNANGSARDFTAGTLAQNKTDLNTWLLGATATNMAYMLSAQLTAAVLSTQHGTVGSSQVLLPALIPFSAQISAAGASISPLGVITINDLIKAADFSLASNNIVLAGNPARPYQEALKNGLEKVASGNAIQLCQPVTNLKTFAASNSSYYNGPTNASPLYASGPFSIIWDPSTNLVTGGFYTEQSPANTGTVYYNNITGGTVSGSTFNLNFNRTVPNSYSFTGTVTLSGNTVTGTLDGPYYFTATGTVTP